MTKYEELAEKKAALEALVPEIEADSEEALTKGAELKAEIEKLEAEIETAEKKASLLGFVGTKEEDMKMNEAKAKKNIGENFVEVVKSKGAGKKFNIIAPEYVKAATDIQVTPAATGVDAYATTFDRNVVEAPRIALVIRDLFAAETISGSTLAFLKEGAIQGAPAATAEAAKKPQVHFADPELVTVTLGKIACFIKESDEYIHDYPFLASAINGRLLYQLGLVEQNTLDRQHIMDCSERSYRYSRPYPGCSNGCTGSVRLCSRWYRYQSCYMVPAQGCKEGRRLILRRRILRRTEYPEPLGHSCMHNHSSNSRTDNRRRIQALRFCSNQRWSYR